MFFVLSGFLITGILLAERDRTGRISLPRFYARRAARLLPALFVLVATFTAYALFVQRADRPSAEHMGATSLYVIAYVANWVQSLPRPGLDAAGSATHGRSRSRSSSTCSGRSA